MEDQVRDISSSLFLRTERVIKRATEVDLDGAREISPIMSIGRNPFNRPQADGGAGDEDVPKGSSVTEPAQTSEGDTPENGSPSTDPSPNHPSLLSGNPEATVDAGKGPSSPSLLPLAIGSPGSSEPPVKE
jgi:hypothetical protein